MTDALAFVLVLIIGLLVGGGLGAAISANRARGQLLDTLTDESRRSEHEAVGVATLIAPLGDSVTRLAAQFDQAQRDRVAADTSLDRMLRHAVAGSDELRIETAKLSRSLGRADVRAQWGEMSLKRAVEAAGLVEHVHFDLQVHLPGPDDESAQRPDAVVNLADGRHIAIDAKVPLHAYLDAIERTDAAPSAADLKPHADAVIAHAKALGSKEYWRRVGSPAFVFMYLPAESLLSAALSGRPDLFEATIAHNVIIATPTTLLAMLRTVAHTWHTDAAVRNASEIHRIGREFYGRLQTTLDHLATVGRSLDGSVDAYNKVLASIESRLLISARRLADLGCVEDDGAQLTNVRPLTRRTQRASQPGGTFGESAVDEPVSGVVGAT